MAKITKKELKVGRTRLPKRRLEFDGERLHMKEALTGSGWHRKSEEKSVGKQQVYHTQDWKDLRKEALQIQPLCECCLAENRVNEATQVDHIVPISVAPEKAFDIDNLWPLCASHHAKKTRLEQSTPALGNKGKDYWGPTLTKRNNDMD